MNGRCPFGEFLYRIVGGIKQAQENGCMLDQWQGHLDILFRACESPKAKFASMK
jgi:hypothetical protein